jgi:hypothetical protein
MQPKLTRNIIREGITEIPKLVEPYDRDPFQAYLTVMARFPDFNLHNAMLISMQNPKAQQVMSYELLSLHHCDLRAGAPCIRIHPPISICRESRSGVLCSEVIGVTTDYVYDVADAKRPLSERSIEACDPSYWLGHYQSHVTDGLELAIEFSDSPHIKDVIVDGHRVLVKSRLTKTKEFAGLVRATSPVMLRKESRSKIPKEIRKIEAEAVTFVVCKAIRCMHSSLKSDNYIEAYRRDDELLMESLLRIHRVATEILGIVGYAIRKESPILGTHWQSWWEDVLVGPIGQDEQHKPEVLQLEP